MGRQAAIYSDAELNRPVKYMVVVCDRNIDTHIIDIEEANQYVAKYARRSIIVSSKEIFKNKNLSPLKYNFVMNATTPAVKLIDHCGQSYKIVYDYLAGNFKNGLIIAHEDTITNNIADMLAKCTGKGFDFIIYRQDLMQLSPAEVLAMNYIRFHANSEFSFTKDNLRQYVEKFGDNIAIGMFTAQMMANEQFNNTQKYFEENSEKFQSMGFSGYVESYEWNKQMAYHVYYNVQKSKIIGMTLEEIKQHMEMVFTAVENKPLFNKASELAVFYS